MRFVVAIAFALLVAPALAQSSLPQSSGCLDHPSIECGQQIRVIDGDTFELDGEIIRLWGIDALELDQTCMIDGELIPAGDDARLWLEDFSRNLDHCIEIDRDQYGQTVARCYRADTAGRLEEINEIMVLFGLAWAHPINSHGVYQRAQAFARERPIGIWQWNWIPPWEWRRQ